MSGMQEAQMLDDVQSVNPITGTETQKGEILYGFCECGCNMKTNIAKKMHKKSGHIKGEPVRFIKGHYKRTQPAKGESYISFNRKYIFVPDHHRNKKNNYIANSIVVAERLTGILIKLPAEVHHFDGNSLNDSPENLVICENSAYHNLLHGRKRAYDACGHAGWLKCPICKEHDDPENMYVNDKTHYHRKCKHKYQKIHYAKKNT